MFLVDSEFCCVLSPEIVDNVTCLLYHTIYFLYFWVLLIQYFFSLLAILNKVKLCS